MEEYQKTSIQKAQEARQLASYENVGAPTKFNDDVVNKLRHAFALDATIEEACFYADISRQTFYNWKDVNPEIFDKLEALRNEPVLAARNTVVSAVRSDPEIALKYLERKRKNEFSLKVLNEHSGEFRTFVIKDEADENNRNRLVSGTNAPLAQEGQS